MQYKTIVLELLQQRPVIEEQLRRNRTLLPTMERYAEKLKTSHEQWMAQLSLAKPGSDKSQIASESLEIALKELEDYLSPVFPPDETDPLSLEEAMAFIRRHTPPE